MRRIALLTALAIIMNAGHVFAIDSSAGTSGAQFLKLGQGSARAMALGGAYVALAEGSDALTSNPAGLAAVPQREFSFSYLRPLQELDSPLYLGYAQPMGRTTFGANFGYMSDSLKNGNGIGSPADVRDANGTPTGTLANVRNYYGSIGAARSFWYEKLFVGVALREIHEDLAGIAHNTLAGDFGGLYKYNNNITLGFALQNIGAKTVDVARVTRGGAAMRLNDFMTVSLELNKASDSKTRLAIGGEFQLPEEYLDIGQFSIRVGYRNADNYGQSKDGLLKSLKLDQSNGLSFGFGMYTSQAFGYGMSLDYAFVPYGALGTVDQISFKIKF